MSVIEKTLTFRDPQEAVENQAREELVLTLKRAFSQGEEEMKVKSAGWFKKELKRRQLERLPRGAAENYLKQEVRSNMGRMISLFVKNAGLFGRDEILDLTRGLGRLYFLAQNAESCSFNLARRRYPPREHPQGVRFRNFMLGVVGEVDVDKASDLEVVDLKLSTNDRKLERQLPRFMISLDINRGLQELLQRCRQTSCMEETGCQIDYIDPETAEVTRVEEKRFVYVDLSEGLSIPLSDAPIEKGKLANRLLREEMGWRV